MRRACQTCENYAALDHECRAHAPRVLMAPHPQTREPCPVSVFPPQRPDSWCGEYVPDPGLAAADEKSTVALGSSIRQ